MKECFRWRASLPTAVPHRLMQDDMYNGQLLDILTLGHRSDTMLNISIVSRHADSKRLDHYP